MLSLNCKREIKFQTTKHSCKVYAKMVTSKKEVCKNKSQRLQVLYVSEGQRIQNCD